MARDGDRAARAGLVVLVGFTLIALAGWGLFGLRPDRLAMLPSWLAGFYGTAFGFFAQAQVWLAALVLALHLGARAGPSWLPALVVLYGLSLGSELLGTTVGLPFGAYAYSELLGPRWFDRVPWLIPASWFVMSVPSYALARLAYPARGQALGRIGLASLILLCWDLSLDPAMSYLTRYWVWADTGPYYGMPWLNLFGWYVTGIVLMSALQLVGAERWIERLSPRWLAWFYGANLLMPLGMNVLGGLGLAVGVTFAALVLAAVWIRVRLVRLGRPAPWARGAPVEVA
jgi:uncharacterized membrane protein